MSGNLTLYSNGQHLTDFYALGGLLAPLWMRVLAIFSTSISAAIGCVGNLAVLLAFARTPSMWTKQNIYVFCLTLSDLIVSTYVNIQDLQQYLLGYWPHSRFYCRFYMNVKGVLYVTSLYLVVLISRDRMLMVVKGISYASYESSRRKWTFAMLVVIYVSFGMFFWSNYDVVSSHTSIFDATGRCEPEQLQNLYVTIFHQTVFGFVPVVLMLYYYAYVRRYIRSKIHSNNTAAENYVSKLTTTRQPPTGREILGISNAAATGAAILGTSATDGGSTGINDAIDRSKRAVRTMAVLILCCLTFSVPFTTLSMIMNVLVAEPTLVAPATFDWWSRLYELTLLFSSAHGAVNPLLYAYAMPAYRVAVKNVALWLWKFPKRKISSVNSSTVR